MVTPWTIIGAPSSAGAHTPGVEKAPRALRDAGLVRLLADSSGADDAGDIEAFRWRPDTSRPAGQNAGAVARVAHDVAERVHTALVAGRRPLVLGGDCTVTLGLVAGAARYGSPPALVYIDGGPDLYTPETRAWGNFDAMGLAHLLALPGTDAGLAGFAGPTPLLRPEKVCIYGTSLPDDDHEQRLVVGLGLHLVDAERVHSDPSVAALDARRFAENAADHFVVHFDVDVLRFVDAPLADVPEAQGLSLEEAARALAALAASRQFAGLSITEINPDHFPDDATLPRFVDAIVEALRGSG